VEHARDLALRVVEDARNVPAGDHDRVAGRHRIRVVLKLVDCDRAREMPGQPVDFERDFLVSSSKRVVN
jgi:hypothetical protein